MKYIQIAGFLSLMLPAIALAQTVTLYQNDFETPNHPIPGSTGFCGTPPGGSGPALDQRGINFLYGSAQGIFQQTNTVEAVIVKNPTYIKPEPNIAGNYALGMLSSVQNDLLWLTFDSQGKNFINVGMDISSIDLNGCGGPFGIADPKFRIALLNGGNTGALLDQEDITGVKGANGATFRWTRHVIALDASNKTTNTITVRWDLLQSGYAAFDNLIITASDTAGDLAQPPTANAGPDQSVNEGANVSLTGLASSDPDPETSLTYKWTQLAPGDYPVVLSDDTSATPSFTAPMVPMGGATLTFQLIVSDGQFESAPDTVDITIVNVNREPIAIAGDDGQVAVGGTFELDGSASYDPDGDLIEFQWEQIAGSTQVVFDNSTSPKPTFVAPVVAQGGETFTFRLHVYDEYGGSSYDDVSVFVEYNNHDPVADAGPDQTVGENSQVILSGSGSDPDGDQLTFSWKQISGTVVELSDQNVSAPTFTAPNLASGQSETLVFELTVDDGYGGRSLDRVEITVIDTNSPPLCDNAVASKPTLWPPNHKMVSVSINGVTDPENNSVAINILGVTQDEPLNGLGDGDTHPDAALQGDKVLLRAERSGLQNGRVYRINFTADDGEGGSCSGTATICVPHDQSPKKAQCIDDGQHYNSLANYRLVQGLSSKMLGRPSPRDSSSGWPGKQVTI